VPDLRENCNAMQEKELPKACVFDAYGTLFDYASAAARFGETLGPRWESLSTLWREKQLQYTWLRTIQDKHADFWQVTGDALDFALEALGIEAAGLRGKLMDAYWTLDAFPEVQDVLERLKRKRIKTAILSNGSPEMLRSAVSQAGLTCLLDEVLSVEEVGVYKPHPKVYQLAVDRLRMPRESISFFSSNAWDAWAASAFGMRVVWCNRYAQPGERLPGLPEHQVASLRDLPFLDRDS
jgi:2-haloacid dehalogenase